LIEFCPEGNNTKEEDLMTEGRLFHEGTILSK
jgi:hypothetical protein